MTTSLATEASQSNVTPAAVQAQGAAKPPSQGLSFSDLLGVINPLQHIPIVSTIYRELTGDTISAAAQIAGDGLYGGVIGLASSVVNQVVNATTGNDIGGHIWATLFDDDADDAKVQTADAGEPTSLLPSTPGQASAPAGDGVSVPVTAQPVSTEAQAADPATGQPVTPLNGPTSFYQKLQTGTHHFKGVPLNTTVPVADPRNNGEKALLDGQNPNTAAGAAVAQAQSLGSTGLAASTSTPPPAIPSAPPPPNAMAAPAVQGNIADKMMQGLDAYKALALKADAANPPSTATNNGGVNPAALMN